MLVRSSEFPWIPPTFRTLDDFLFFSHSGLKLAFNLKNTHLKRSNFKKLLSTLICWCHIHKLKIWLRFVEIFCSKFHWDEDDQELSLPNLYSDEYFDAVYKSRISSFIEDEWPVYAILKSVQNFVLLWNFTTDHVPSFPCRHTTSTVLNFSYQSLNCRGLVSK